MNARIVSFRDSQVHQPVVNLGRTRPDLLSANEHTLAPRTSSHIAAERDAALAEREALEASRPDMMLLGSAEQIADLTRRIIRRIIVPGTLAETAAEAEARGQRWRPV